MLGASGWPLDWPLAVAFDVALLGFSGAWTWRMATRPGTSPWPAIVASAALPFVAPDVWSLLRIVASVLAVTTAAKVWMVHRGGPGDRAMVANPGRFALWFLIPPESTWPVDAAAVGRARGLGRRRAMRALVKLPAIAGLYALHATWSGLHAVVWVEAFWALWVCWLSLSAFADLVTAVLMQWGIDFDELFDAPPLSTSPRDFWGRRWNLFVHRFAARYLFMPLGGRRRPGAAMMLVFVCSGLMHEYFVAGCLGGLGRHTGYMTAFFVLHGLGVVLELRLRRRRGAPRLRPPVAIVAHIAWLTVTGPLFFLPLSDVFVGW